MTIIIPDPEPNADTTANLGQPINTGDTVTLTAQFADDNSDPATPGTVTFQARNPYGTTSTAATTNPEPGLYTATIIVDQPGVWSYRFTGTAPHAGVIEKRLTVHDTAFA